MKQKSTCRTLLAGIALLIFASCAQVVSVGPDTYSAYASGAGFSDKGCRARDYRAADDYCRSRGLVMMPVSIVTKGGIIAYRPPVPI